ncbi:hypothetical protein CapIbe_023721 [Capra ibex]
MSALDCRFINEAGGNEDWLVHCVNWTGGKKEKSENSSIRVWLHPLNIAQDIHPSVHPMAVTQARYRDEPLPGNALKSPQASRLSASCPVRGSPVIWWSRAWQRFLEELHAFSWKLTKGSRAGELPASLNCESGTCQEHGLLL